VANSLDGVILKKATNRKSLQDLKGRNLNRHPSKLTRSSHTSPKDEEGVNLPPIDGAVRISHDRSSKYSIDEQKYILSANKIS
jgi:hypothetical protein